MASSGKDAWDKHFSGKGNIETVMKKDSSLLNQDLNPVGNIKAGEKIIFLDTPNYSDKMPIEYNSKIFFVTFNNIQKPKSKLVSGIKLKPQNYTFFTQETWKAEDLAKRLINENEERTDLDADLKHYLNVITDFWGKTGIYNANDLSNLKAPSKGINEIKKDYGEMLGAIACVTHKILAPSLNISDNDTLTFPLRGNEPIVDYYINDSIKQTRYNISAKSGSTTNTLKAADVITLLKSQNKYSKWQTKDITKFIDLIANNSVLHFPFLAINLVQNDKILNDSAIKEAMAFKASKLSEKTYNIGLFSKLINLIEVPNTTNINKPTIGQLFYYTEKKVIEVANQKFNPTQIFKEATSGSVIYVKYSINSKPQGEFDVLIGDVNKESVQKDIKWRSKNSTNRTSDKIGMQP
jgi:hypothetical protein